MRSGLALVPALVLGAAPVPSVSLGTTEPPGESPFEIPAERWKALEAAGLGWIFDADGYPAMPLVDSPDLVAARIVQAFDDAASQPTPLGTRR